ncbi:MAG: exodeoxyribonuclease VII small subunit [Pseudomonadota bacterium]
MTEKPITDLSFEEALAELEKVVGQLEGGQVPLEQSIELYKRGDALKALCEARLQDAELEVQKITGGTPDNPDLAPFEET